MKRGMSIFLAFVMLFTSCISVYGVDVPASDVQQQPTEYINEAGESADVNVSEQENTSEGNTATEAEKTEDVVEDEKPAVVEEENKSEQQNEEREGNEDAWPIEASTTAAAIMPMMAAVEFNGELFLGGGSSLDSATVAPVDTVVNSSISVKGEIDFFEFTAPYKGDYTITTKQLTGLSKMSVYLYKKGSTSSIVWTSYSYANPDLVIVTGLDPGEYILKFYANSTQAGNYSFNITKTLRDDHGDNFEEATKVEVEKDISAFLDYKGDVDYFEFTAPYKGDYTITTKQLTGLSKMSVYLYKKGSTSSIVWTSYSYANPDLVIVTGLDPGEYILKFYANSTQAGNYSFNITKTLRDDHGDNFEEATKVEVEKDISAFLDYKGDVDYFEFTAPYKGDYTITTKQLTGLSKMSVYLYKKGSTSSIVWTSYSYANPDLVIVTGLDPGEYILKFYANSTQAGNYSFNITKTSKDDYSDIPSLGNPKKINTLYKGMINYKGDPDYLSFDVTEAGKYEIGSYAYGDMPIQNMYTYLYKDTNGTLSTVGSGSFNTTTKKTAFTATLQPGKYILHLKGYSASYTGNYRFYLLKDGATLVETPDTMINGTVYYDSILSIRNASYNMITNLAVDSLDIVNGQLYLAGTIKGELGEQLPINTMGKIYNNVSQVFEGEELVTADFHDTGNLTMLSAEIEKSAREDMLLHINRERLKGKEVIKLSFWDEEKDRIYYFEDELPEGFQYDQLKAVAVNPDDSSAMKMENELLWFFDFMPINIEEPTVEIFSSPKAKAATPFIWGKDLNDVHEIIPRVNFTKEGQIHLPLNNNRMPGMGYFTYTKQYPIKSSEGTGNSVKEKQEFAEGKLNTYYIVYTVDNKPPAPIKGTAQGFSLDYLPGKDYSSSEKTLTSIMRVLDTNQTVYDSKTGQFWKRGDQLLNIGNPEVTFALINSPEIVTKSTTYFKGQELTPKATYQDVEKQALSLSKQ